MQDCSGSSKGAVEVRSEQAPAHREVGRGVHDRLNGPHERECQARSSEHCKSKAETRSDASHQPRDCKCCEQEEKAALRCLKPRRGGGFEADAGVGQEQDEADHICDRPVHSDARNGDDPQSWTPAAPSQYRSCALGRRRAAPRRVETLSRLGHRLRVAASPEQRNGTHTQPRGYAGGLDRQDRCRRVTHDCSRGVQRSGRGPRTHVPRNALAARAAVRSKYG
jgi:hypothetical protein